MLQIKVPNNIRFASTIHIDFLSIFFCSSALRKVISFRQEENTQSASHCMCRSDLDVVWHGTTAERERKILSLFPNSEYLIKTFAGSINNSGGSSSEKKLKSKRLTDLDIFSITMQWSDGCVIAWSSWGRNGAKDTNHTHTHFRIYAVVQCLFPAIVYTVILGTPHRCHNHWTQCPIEIHVCCMLSPPYTLCCSFNSICTLQHPQAVNPHFCMWHHT